VRGYRTTTSERRVQPGWRATWNTDDTSATSSGTRQKAPQPGITLPHRTSYLTRSSPGWAASMVFETSEPAECQTRRPRVQGWADCRQLSNPLAWITSPCPDLRVLRRP